MRRLRRPRQAMQETRAAVLIAVMTQPAPTVRSICEATGIRSTSTCHEHLKTLRREGLVDWDDNHGRGGQHSRRGTLRPKLEVVAIDRSLLVTPGRTMAS